MADHDDHDDRDVNPDDSLLKQIFNDNQPDNITILAQTWTKCIFKAEFSQGPPELQINHPPCVVRLEDAKEASKSFTMIAALQQVAATIIPDLVPQTLQVGEATNAQGRLFCFSVVEFVKGDLLEDVWQDMSAEDHTSVVAELVEALRKLHAVPLHDPRIQKILGTTLEVDDQDQKTSEQPHNFGGPHTGVLTNGLALLESIMQRRKVRHPFCEMKPVPDTGDIILESKYPDLGTVHIDHSSISKWPSEAIFSHNDLTPRNLLIHSPNPTAPHTTYHLASILDWEMSGYYPPAYELSLQETYTSCPNRHLTFFLLFKSLMTPLIPRSTSQVQLLRANRLVFESQQRLLAEGGNIPAVMRRRFLEGGGLVGGEGGGMGTVKELSKEELEELEDEVIAEVYAKIEEKRMRVEGRIEGGN